MQSQFDVGMSGDWTVSGNTADGVPADGAALYFDPNPADPASSFNVIGSGSANQMVLSPASDHLTGGTANDVFVVEHGSDLSSNAAVDSIDDAGGTDDAIVFASATSGDTLTVGANVTHIEEVDIVDPNTFLSSGTLAENVDASAAPNGLTIVGNDGANTITGTAFNDTIIGGAGTDTVVYSQTLSASDFSYNAVTNQWTVTAGSDGTDTLTGVEKVSDGSHTFLLVDPSGSYTSIQAAVNAAQPGDTILIGAGTYHENVVITTAGVTLQGLGGVTI